MPSFSYKGRKAGKVVEGVIEAANPAAVRAQLAGGGITPLKIAEAREQADVVDSLNKLLGLGKVSLEEMVMFSRQMYTLTRAGVPIIRTIAGLSEGAKNPRLAAALSSVAQSLESGRDLGSSLAMHPDIFSNLFISVVGVGENTGQLEESFLQIGKYLENELETGKQIKAAMRYPVIVLVAIAAAIAVINIWVIPAFASVFNALGSDLPWQTVMLVQTSDFFVNYWPHMLVSTVFIVMGFKRYTGSGDGRLKWDKFKLKIPIVGSITERATLARFARSFSMSMAAGVPLIQSLTVVSRVVDNAYVGHCINQMRGMIERGGGLTQSAAATGLFTPLVLQMLSVGEATGNVDTLLTEVADFYEREVDYALKKMGDSIEPLMMVIIGAMVLVLALGVYLPMWDLSTAMK